MKNIINLFIFFLCYLKCLNINAQLNTLKAPASPAANILGIAPSELPVFSDATKLAAHIKSSTENFTNLPKSYAFDIAPFLIFNKTNDIKDFNGRKNGKKVYKSEWYRDIVLSIGYMDSLDVDLTKDKPQRSKIALAIRIPFFSKNLTENSESVLKTYSEHYEEELGKYDLLNADEVDLLFLGKKVKSKKDLLLIKSKKSNDLAKKFNIEYEDLIKEDYKIYKKYQNKIILRDSLNLNLCAGMVWDKTERIQQKNGFWLTGAYDINKKIKNIPKFENQFSIIGMFRYLYGISPEYTDLKGPTKGQFIDFGVKLNFINTFPKRFNIGLEAIFRNPKLNNQNNLASVEIDTFNKSKIKYDINFEYEISKNFLLTFVFGKDFEGNISKKGNVFSLLNLVGGIGQMQKN